MLNLLAKKLPLSALQKQKAGQISLCRGLIVKTWGGTWDLNSPHFNLYGEAGCDVPAVSGLTQAFRGILLC